MPEKIKFKVKSDKFSDLISKLDDLTKIDDTIKLKIDSENILMYSIVGGDRIMLAFKNYLIKTNEYFEMDDFDFTIDLIIPSSKSFVKNLNFLKLSDNISMEISYKESREHKSVMNARSFQVSGGKLKVNWIASEHFEMRDISKDSLVEKLDLSNRKWNFPIDRQDFLDIKKLSNINSSRIINVSVTKGKVVLSETSAWELEIGKIEDDRNANFILNKKFLSCINDNNDVEFNIFETFILLKDDNSNLMLSFEQDFSDD